MKFKCRMRYEFLFLLSLPKNSICAEIGVWKGLFSDQIIRAAKPKELHLIDPWDVSEVEEIDRRWYQFQLNRLYNRVVRKFNNQPSVHIHRGKSADVLPTFCDGYFDWIYVDGRHDYVSVTRDLQLSWKKVKIGGLIAGDDYAGRCSVGVKGAVDDFVSGLGVPLSVFHSQFAFRKAF